MASKLAFVAFTGFAVAAVCMGAAAAIGTGSLSEKDIDISFFGGPSCGRADGGATTRDMAWDGSDQAVLSVPGEVHYAPGNGDTMRVSGDATLISHVRIRDGRIELDCHRWHGSDRLTITLPGRQFRKFGIAGSGKLVLDNLDQGDLKVSIAGSGDIRGNGRVDHLEVHIAGSGDADMAKVAANVAKVHIAGSGDADIAPKDDADIHISGSGDVTLHSAPAHMETHIAGSGSIRSVGGGS